MTSKDGEYWRCWSCGRSYSKVELFRIQNSLSYEEACGNRNFPKAGLVYDYIGEKFDDSSYQKIRQELIHKADTYKKIKEIYTKRIKDVSQ